MAGIDDNMQPCCLAITVDLRCTMREKGLPSPWKASYLSPLESVIRPTG